LKNIVRFSAEKKALSYNLRDLTEKIANKELDNEQLDDSFSELEKDLLIKKKRIHCLELEAGELNDAEKEFRAKAEMVSNQKELNSVTHELQNVQKKRNSIEDLLIREWNFFEREKIDFDAYQREYNKAKKENKGLMDAMQQEINDLQTKIDPMQEMIQTESKLLPENIRDIYMRIESKKIKDPIAPFYSGICGACYYTVTPQFAKNIETTKVSTCENCYRILYLRPQEEESKKAETLPEVNDNS
jgi:predicted  nucleic acid-binding Zn-ribbon protein